MYPLITAAANFIPSEDDAIDRLQKLGPLDPGASLSTQLKSPFCITRTVVFAVTLIPSGLVTASVNSVVSVSAPLETPLPDMTGPIPLSMMPSPPEKTAVRTELPPTAMVAGTAVKLPQEVLAKIVERLIGGKGRLERPRGQPVG